MKRFWLFIGRIYYPAGGMRDLSDSFDTAEEACHSAINLAMNDLPTACELSEKFDFMWAHVFDSQINEIVFVSNSNTGEMIPSKEE